jgi:hypothetical protein
LDEDWTEGWRVRRAVSLVVATVVVVGAIFVPIRGTMAPRIMAAATDKAVAPIPAAGKRWDTTTPSCYFLKRVLLTSLNVPSSH